MDGWFNRLQHVLDKIYSILNFSREINTTVEVDLSNRHMGTECLDLCMKRLDSEIYKITRWRMYIPFLITGIPADSGFDIFNVFGSLYLMDFRWRHGTS